MRTWVIYKQKHKLCKAEKALTSTFGIIVWPILTANKLSTAHQSIPYPWYLVYTCKFITNSTEDGIALKSVRQLKLWILTLWCLALLINSYKFKKCFYHIRLATCVLTTRMKSLLGQIAIPILPFGIFIRSHLPPPNTKRKKGYTSQVTFRPLAN